MFPDSKFPIDVDGLGLDSLLWTRCQRKSSTEVKLTYINFPITETFMMHMNIHTWALYLNKNRKKVHPKLLQKIRLRLPVHYHFILVACQNCQWVTSSKESLLMNKLMLAGREMVPWGNGGRSTFFTFTISNILASWYWRRFVNKGMATTKSAASDGSFWHIYGAVDNDTRCLRACSWVLLWNLL